MKGLNVFGVIHCDNSDGYWSAKRDLSDGGDMKLLKIDSGDRRGERQTKMLWMTSFQPVKIHHMLMWYGSMSTMVPSEYSKRDKKSAG